MRTIQLKKEAIHRGNLILVNQKYGYVQQQNMKLVPAWEEEESILIRREASVLLNQLMNDINGWEQIVPVSGWRSQLEQQQIWDDSLAESGLEFTKTYVAVPGHSEHQTGLALDLGLKQEEIDFIRPAFPYEGICQIFRERAIQYGFVERYPAHKEQITKIGQEPWHFRYVGAPHAAIMAEHEFVLEEYISFLRQFCYHVNPYIFQIGHQEIAVSYLKASRDITEVKMEDSSVYSISGNNVDGFIITIWRNEYGYRN